MKRLQTFKFELMPNGGQTRLMRRFAGSCRFAYNKALALQKERYKQNEKKLGYAGLCNLLTEWRHNAQTNFKENADIVGAINILRAGHARLACEVNGDVIPSTAGTHRGEALDV